MSRKSARLMVLVGIVTAGVLSAHASGASIRIRDASGYAGGTTSVGVNFSSTESVAGINFRVTYDASKLQFLSATEGSAATAADKDVAYGIPDTGVASILVYGLNQNAIPGGRIADLHFVILGSPAVGTAYPLVGTEPSSTDTEGDPVDTSISDGAITVSACVTPSAPSNLSATDGTMTDRVRVTWNPANGATSYRIYRSVSSNFASAQLLADTASTTYDDYGASPAALASSGGCGASSTLQFTSHYYWVVSQSPCATSAAAGPDSGYRGGSKSISQARTYETVLPAPASEVIGVTDSIAIRVRTDEAVAEIWGRVEASGLADDRVQWVPAQDGVKNDGWVVYEPASPWVPGDAILMTVGGSTTSGAAVAPLSYAFRVKPASSVKANTLVAQPSYDEGIGQAVEVWLEDESTVPESPFALGPIVSIQPNGAYSSPRRVWLPVPDGASPDAVSVYYFQGTPADGAWHEGTEVDGWLVENSELLLDTSEGAYFGCLVNHGGIAQLGRRIPGQLAAQASLGPDLRWKEGLLENLILFGLVLAALAFSHVYGSRRKRPIA